MFAFSSPKAAKSGKMFCSVGRSTLPETIMEVESSLFIEQEAILHFHVGWMEGYIRYIYIYKSISLYLGVISLHLGVMISTSPSNGSKVIYSPIVYIYVYILHRYKNALYLSSQMEESSRRICDRFSGQERSLQWSTALLT